MKPLKIFPLFLLFLIQPQSTRYAPTYNSIITAKEFEGFDSLEYLILIPTLSSAQATTSEMFIPNTLVARDDGADMIAIIACSIAGIGFFFWAIHAIRKMRESPFNEPEDKVEPRENDGGQFPTAFDNSPLVPPDGRTLSPAERVRTRLFLSQPEEPFYRPTPISTDASNAQGSVTTPRMPPRAGGQSHRSSSRSTRHGSLTRGGPPGERHEYEYNMNNGYMGNISSSRATGFPAGQGYMRNTSHSHADTSSGDYRRQSLKRTNIEPVTYCG